MNLRGLGLARPPVRPLPAASAAPGVPPAGLAPAPVVVAGPATKKSKTSITDKDERGIDYEARYNIALPGRADSDRRPHDQVFGPIGRLGGARGPPAEPRPIDSPLEDNVTVIDMGWRVPKPDGKVDSYYDDSEDYGPKWWRDKIRRIVEIKHHPVYQLLQAIGSKINKSADDLMNNDMLNNLLDDFSALSALAVKDASTAATVLAPGVAPSLGDAAGETGRKGKFTDRFERMVENALDDGPRDEPGPSIRRATVGSERAYAPGEEGAAQARRQEQLDSEEKIAKFKLLSELAKIESKKDRMFNKMSHKDKREVLFELLSHEGVTRADLEIVRELFPDEEKPKLNWITHPFVGGLMFVKDEIIGHMDACVATFNERERTTRLQRHQLVTDGLREYAARWIAANRNYYTKNRFTSTEKNTNRYLQEREAAMNQLICAYHGRPILSDSQEKLRQLGLDKFNENRD